MGGGPPRKREIAETLLCRDFLAGGFWGGHVNRAKAGVESTIFPYFTVDFAALSPDKPQSPRPVRGANVMTLHLGRAVQGWPSWPKRSDLGGPQ
jgi:hypothetical protein